MAGLLITGLSVTAAMGTLSMATSLANGVYALSDRIVKSTDTGITDIKKLMESSDLKNRIDIMNLFIQEIDADDSTPHSIQEAIKSIKKAIIEIEKELRQIQYKIDYNDNLYFSAVGMRSYKLDNSYKNLETKISTLNTRYETLKTLFSMRHLLNPNRIKKRDDTAQSLDAEQQMLEVKLE